MNTSFINNQLNYIQMDREKEIEKMYSNGYPNGFGKRKHIDSSWFQFCSFEYLMEWMDNIFDPLNKSYWLKTEKVTPEHYTYETTKEN